MPNFISEAQIELKLLQQLQQVHGYEVLRCHSEDAGDLADGSCRADKREIFLVDRVREAAVRLNKNIPEAVIDSALESLMDRRQAMSLVAANREIYDLLRDGIYVEFDDTKGNKRQERVRLIDFNEYKRRQAAPGLKVTTKAFGLGRRIPIAQRYRNG